MGGMLVDEDEAVLGLGDDIGGGDLAAGDAEGVGVGLGDWRGRRFRRGPERRDIRSCDSRTVSSHASRRA